MKEINLSCCRANYPLCCFDARIAKTLGIPCALGLNNLVCIDDTNKLLCRHYAGRRQVEGVINEDGLIWSRHSLKYFSEQFPFYTEGKILNTLGKLEENGLIKIRPSLTNGFYWVAVTMGGDEGSG